MGRAGRATLHLDDRQQMLRPRARDVPVGVEMRVVLRRHLDDHDGIGFQPLEAAPRGNECSTVASPLVEALRQRNGLEVRRPALLGKSRRQHGDLRHLEPALVGHAQQPHAPTGFLEGLGQRAHANGLGCISHRCALAVAVLVAHQRGAVFSDAHRIPAVLLQLVGSAELAGQRGMLDVQVLLGVVEDVVAALVAGIPEHRVEARPPEIVEVLALVDDDGIEFVLGAEPFTGLHQGLGSGLRPERLVLGIAHLLQPQAGRLAQVVRQPVIGVDTAPAASP